ncbi:GTPase-activating Rap/Ran-GAP domain-like protein 3 isoform X2 [Pectinophora gossypiella]|uniref:GTPase-activating Rap/Ran-GAP domain-like protein 3 isoform X2 n=1 Tax=Pectinophora gossypiella TaxID=13191 RepID=UPI00214F3075|nr:GTPase-activating Rap/Ran-GAP domain-like protein 3 isoform X2 [Pectinophora gossypiella]
MVCDGGAMLCLESLMARWRERGEREGERRARSRSLCSSADGSLLQLLHRRASSAISSASELISRRGVFSRRQYGSVEQLSGTAGDPGTLDAVQRRYRLENGNSLGEKDELFGPPSAPVLENPEFQTRWYFKYFLGKMHQNYIGVDGAREPYLLSVVQEGGAGLLRAILFNKMGAHKIYLPPSAWNSGGGGQAPTRPTVKQILAQFPAMERVDKVPREITCAELQKDVLLLEEQEGSVNFKIGVMLMTPGQKTDDEMLSNEKGDEKWERFISLLGDKIRLRGWNRFRGGLDVKGDMTGSHSIYTMHQGHEIMFHVSTMLPFSKDNKQQLERKRHIGNDIVNIVFTDDCAHNTFNPQCVKSHFTHIFAVVSEVEGEGYRLSVYSDDTVPPFGPSLPCPPVFNDPQLFREFLLVKLMNGEKAAFQTPTFALKRQRTLDTLIRDIYAEHCSDHKVPMLSRRALSDVWSGGAGAGGAGAARTERFLHVGQALKLDAVLRGDAPTSLVSTGSGGSRRAPWEGRVWRSAPLPATPVCAEQLAEGRLLLSTTSNTYILEETGTTRVVLRWEGCVRAARVTERAGLFRVGARVIGGGSTTGGAGGAGLYALPLQELCAGAWAMRPLQDCKHARLPRTKTAHYFDVLEQGEGGKTTLAVAVGRRVLLMLEEQKTDSEMGFEYTHIKDIQLSESPVLIKLMDGEVGVLVVGYKHHWEVLESTTGQVVKRAESSDDNTPRRGTLVNALRIGDERDGQIVLCYNHTCHFERLTTKGMESDGEYDFHWTTVPAAVVCAFPYIMAFAEDLLEIRLVANGSLVHAACIPGLKLLCGRRDIFYVACAPEYVPLTREIDPCFLQHDNELMRQMSNKCGPYSVDEDDNNENKGESNPSQNNRTLSETNSTSSRSSSLSSEHENIRPPLTRMAPISPPSSPQVLPENSGRCVRIYKIPQSNLSAGTYQRQSVSADQVVTSYFSDRPNSMRQRLAELRLDSKSRGGGDDETL